MRDGIHFDAAKIYAPVAKWNSIRILLALVAINNWHTVQLDYVLAYTQASVKREIYMKTPKGFELEGTNKDEYVLKLQHNVYGQKQA